eukprot:PLAT13466.1.p1 GENE.PLAT13466.1~~PLAT13466.1.p1  ORF type:complete len:307 (+),score=125.52 PLAT13466.1:531-1451(+)
MAEDGSADSRVGLHPLVIINVSDHYTRALVQSKRAAKGEGEGDSKTAEVPRILGALFGVQTGRKVEVLNSFELVFSRDGEGKVQLDADYLEAKRSQFSQVFPAYELLGWYSAGEEVAEEDMHIHSLVSAFNENPLYLLLHPNSAGRGGKELPLSIFESELHVVADTPTMIFVKAAYAISSLEAERICVDHVAKTAPSGGGAGALVRSHMGSVENSVKMLAERVRVLRDVLAAMKAGELPMDHKLLRAIGGLVSKLPTADGDRFRTDFMSEHNDTLLIALLASMAKGALSVHDLVDKHLMAYEHRVV